MKKKFYQNKYIYLTIISLNFSCFHKSNEKEAQLASQPSLGIAINNALTSSAFKEGTFENEQWWTLFSDPQLNALISQALEQSPTLKVAEAKVATAQASAKIAYSTLFPTIGASALDSWNYLSKYGFDRSFFPLPEGDAIIPKKFNETDLSLNFSYEIDFFGKNRKKLKAALGIALAEAMEKKQASLLLCMTVAFTYFEWQAHFAEKDLYERWLTLERELSTYFSSRYDKGLNNRLSPLTQETKLEEIKLKVIQKQRELEIDELFLKNLIGESPDFQLLLTPTPELLRKKIPLPSSIDLNLLSQRPDLMAQIWRVEAASKSIGVAKTEFYPNVNLRAFAGLSSLTFPHLFEWASRTGALNPAINLPIFTGGELRANLAQKVALFNEAVYSYNELLLQAAQEVASEITTFLSLESEIQTQSSIIKSQQETVHLSTLRYQIGVDDRKSVLEASIDLISQETRTIALTHACILSSLRIIKSLGGGMDTQQLPSIALNP